VDGHSECHDCALVAAGPGLNRWLNLIVGGFSLLALVATFFTGELSLRYLIQAAAEALFIAAIIYHAWSWRGS
jgi:hypothetical protein